MNFMERIKKFCEENDIPYQRQAEDVAVLGDGKITVVRTAKFKYKFHIGYKIKTFKAYDFREAFETIRSEMKNDK